MRSLAAQLVALALAVPVSTVSSSHASSSQLQLDSRTAVAVQPARAFCGAYCQARTLRHKLKRVHGRTVALAHRAALPVPPPPRLGWRRATLRVQLAHHARVLGRSARRRGARCACASSASRPGSASTGTRPPGTTRGDPYWGGLQMDRGFMRAYGSDMIARHRGGLADTWTPAEQIVVAERAYATRGFAPWPNTARSCGLR